MKQILVVLGMVFLLSSYAVAVEHENCDAKKIRSALLSRIDKIKNYKTDITVTVDQVISETHVMGISGKTLLINQEIKAPKYSIVNNVVFDGSTQWVESSRASAKQVLKLTISELTSSMRPFDTGYYITGTGLLSGEDYVGTLKTLLNIFSLKINCSQSAINISGQVDKSAYTNYVKNIKTKKSSDKFIQQFITQFGYLKAQFSRKEMKLEKYSLGSSLNDTNFSAVFRNTEYNVNGKEMSIKYQLPKNTQAIDITSQIKLAR